ncbi:hypothetical protein [Pseudarthrobacter oxydans]|jgi:hypothetical protein|uniref:hypothetical protein n=1 Tax=Pseudarthrobacter oxydans TaxID=1671 RepID=UPI003F4E0A74
MSFDQAFLGADAVTAEDGICKADHAQIRLLIPRFLQGAWVYPVRSIYFVSGDEGGAHAGADGRR